jgi:uncharacterized protein GlcG (DUF336 family)
VVADGKTEHGDRTLDEVRQEVVAAADDLERMTAELRSRTRLVERLEALADTLLDLVAVPVVVVDTEGRIAAVSRCGASELPGLAESLGKPVSAVLPEPLAGEIVAFVTAGSTPLDLTDAPASPRNGTRLVALPDGYAMVVW